MSENTDKNQDPKDPQEAEEPINYLAESSTTDVDDPNALDNLDKLLTEEDPEFLKQISDISIDPSEVNYAMMNDSMGSIDPAKLRMRTWKFHLQNLFTSGDEPKKFFLFWGLVLGSIGFIGFGLNYSEKLISKGLFLTSYAEWGGKVHTFDPATEVEPFFDNPRFAKNLMTMTKMVANIRPSENSGSNPMLAIEINIEGMSSEAIIEIKDREAEFKDILLRVTEDFSYDELVAAEGKKGMLGRFQASINANLTQGQVRRVLLKSFIIKP